jgi:hypothetical protein
MVHTSIQDGSNLPQPLGYRAIGRLDLGQKVLHPQTRFSAGLALNLNATGDVHPAGPNPANRLANVTGMQATRQDPNRSSRNLRLRQFVHTGGALRA